MSGFLNKDLRIDGALYMDNTSIPSYTASGISSYEEATFGFHWIGAVPSNDFPLYEIKIIRINDLCILKFPQYIGIISSVDFIYSDAPLPDRFIPSEIMVDPITVQDNVGQTGKLNILGSNAITPGIIRIDSNANGDQFMNIGSNGGFFSKTMPYII